jgi:PIN domain nuclease of toxin-antitoxin system
MRILVDTHAFLYFISGGAELSPVARTAIENPSHQRFLSIVSLWEIAIKVSIQKLEAPSANRISHQYSLWAEAQNVGCDLR